MMTVDQLSRLSDNLVLSAIAVLSLSLLAHAAELLLARHPNRRAATAMVPAGGASVLPATQEEAASSGRGPDRAELTGRVGTTLAVLAFALVCAAVLVRGFAAGRVPWGNMYEFALTGSASVGIAYLIVLRRRPIRLMGLWVVALVLSLLGVSYTLLHTPVDDLVPVLESTWLIVHVAAAIIAGGLFTIGAVATTAHLVATRRGAVSDRSAVYAQVAHTVHLVAFPIWTFAVIAGAIWAENAWGRYWGWDPKETWAFITWVFYAAHLHALSTAGWRRAAGVLALLGFAAFVFNFFGVNIWIPGLHSYAGV